ncbi:hypothetical protein K435DRAFT_436498 [Dendrothele bispora CBS 962.96]|uniref:Uncharacterized protein n=1 Tax=Dendrothele bispora (strain CBS 962.96) TaxID=1314807 RepID=A0A4S8L3G7_DENBC|nr:hypothetical protein K435DRAFT_436498 [Dendrothele bispora CBS 962.96]
MLSMPSPHCFSFPSNWYHFAYSLSSQKSTCKCCPRQTSEPSHLESSLILFENPFHSCLQVFTLSRECPRSKNITSEG